VTGRGPVTSTYNSCDMASDRYQRLSVTQKPQKHLHLVRPGGIKQLGSQMDVNLFYLKNKLMNGGTKFKIMLQAVQKDHLVMLQAVQKDHHLSFQGNHSKTVTVNPNEIAMK
jgi:hypothetical protein